MSIARRITRHCAGLLLLALAACQGGGATEPSRTEEAEGPVAPGFDPIVIPNPGARGDVPLRERRPVGEEDAGWAEKHRLATGYARGGYEEEALAVIRAVLAQDPPASWADRFRALRASLRVQHLSLEVLRADVRGERDYVAFGRDLLWHVRLRNVSGREVVFPAPGSEAAGGGSAVLTLRVVRRDVDIYGAELRRTWNRTLPLERPGGAEIRIAPRRHHVVPVRVPAEDVGPALSGLRILRMDGTLRISGVRVGDREEAGTLPVRAGRVVVLPAGFEPIARDPLGSLRAATDALAPTHLLVAAEFVSADQVPEALVHLTRTLTSGEPALGPAAMSAIRLLRERVAGRPVAPLARPLVEALDTHPARADALMEALSLLSGEARAPDPRLWRDWWRRATETNAEVPDFSAAREENGEGR